MDHEFDWIKSIEDGRASLVGILRANRRMNDYIPKRRRGFHIAIIVLVASTAVLYLAFGFAMGRSDRGTKVFAAQLLLVITLIYILMLVILRFVYITRPIHRYRKALKSFYPGLDVSSESSIKNYVWSMPSDPYVMLRNLCQLIQWEGEARVLQGAVPNEVYSPAERAALDVWRTRIIELELVDLHNHHEHEIAYLDGAIESFKRIGADDEADIWAEVRSLFDKLKEWDGESPVEEYDGSLFVFSYDGEELYALREEIKNQIFDLQERLNVCRDDTETKLYNYVMLHKDEITFE